MFDRYYPYSPKGCKKVDGLPREKKVNCILRWTRYCHLKLYRCLLWKRCISLIYTLWCIDGSFSTACHWQGASHHRVRSCRPSIFYSERKASEKNGLESNTWRSRCHYCQYCQPCSSHCQTNPTQNDPCHFWQYGCFCPLSPLCCILRSPLQTFSGSNTFHEEYHKHWQWQTCDSQQACRNSQVFTSSRRPDWLWYRQYIDWNWKK